MFNEQVHGKPFSIDEFMKSAQNEIERGTMKTKMREDGEMTLWFEPLHPINKYPELDTYSHLCDEVRTGAIKPKDH